MATIGQLRKHLGWRLAPRNLELVRLALWPRRRRTRTLLVAPGLEVPDGPSFCFMYHPIFNLHQFRFEATQAAPRVLDCGANIGLVTIYVKRLHPRARVTAFEPDPEVFQTLQANVTRRCKLEDVELVNAAVSVDSADAVSFQSEGLDSGRLGRALAGAAEITVRTSRLREWLTEPVDLLKLDIEGAELAVLEDCQDRLHLVKNLFVEYHSFKEEPQEIDRLITILRDSGFRLDFHSERLARSPFLGPEVYLGMDAQLNIFARRS